MGLHQLNTHKRSSQLDTGTQRWAWCLSKALAAPEIPHAGPSWTRVVFSTPCKAVLTSITPPAAMPSSATKAGHRQWVKPHLERTQGSASITQQQQGKSLVSILLTNLGGIILLFQLHLPPPRNTHKTISKFTFSMATSPQTKWFTKLKIYGCLNVTSWLLAEKQNALKRGWFLLEGEKVCLSYQCSVPQ